MNLPNKLTVMRICLIPIILLIAIFATTTIYFAFKAHKNETMAIVIKEYVEKIKTIAQKYFELLPEAKQKDLLKRQAQKSQQDESEKQSSKDDLISDIKESSKLIDNENVSAKEFVDSAGKTYEKIHFISRRRHHKRPCHTF